KRYGESQGENQLDGLIYAYAMDQLGFRTAGKETLIRYDVLVKTKSPAFQQIYFNKTPSDYGRLARWIQEVLQAIDRESFFPNFGWALQALPFSLSLLKYVSKASLQQSTFRPSFNPTI